MLTTNIFQQRLARSFKQCLSTSLSMLRSQSQAMSSDRKEHLELTSDQYRDPEAVPAQIVAIDDLSSTVKRLELKVDQKIVDGGLQFKPGQWMDFFIPRIDQVGGFSMSSSPSALKSSGTIELAVKFSTWAPANWVHTVCTVGHWVTFRFGGDFHYPVLGLEEDHSLLLIGGGVGINPLLSIFRHSAELQSQGATTAPSKVNLLYSAARKEELLFREDISKQCADSDNFHAQYFVTKERTETGEYNDRRITRSDIEQVLRDSGRDVRTICYLCGPPQMVDQLRLWLTEINVRAEDIKYELWW